jgi:hypothetical protein
MKKLLCLLVLLVFPLLVSQAMGAPITFGDTQKYWPGWRNWTSDDNTDYIGTPNFTGGYANIYDSGYLKSLTFNIKNPSNSGSWGILMPGDLFIDADADHTWDYTVNLIKYEGGTWITGDNKLYSISQPLGGTGYDMASMPGYGIRENHPVAYEGGTSIANINFSGWPTNPYPYTGTATFSFNDYLVPLWENFTIGWTVQCANDVIYQTMTNPNPVPEPASMLLLGSGLIGMAAYGRKRFAKKGKA